MMETSRGVLGAVETVAFSSVHGSNDYRHHANNKTVQIQLIVLMARAIATNILIQIISSWA